MEPTVEQQHAAYVAQIERQHFQYMVHQATPRVWVYKALIASNIAVFLVMLASGISMWWPDPVAVIPWANFGPYTADGEWWRLLTCAFVHFGLIHIGFNMYALKILGPFLERLYGNAEFLAVYLLSAVGGSLASLVFHPATPSAGASGAIFGLIGGLLGFVVIARRSIPPTVFRNLRTAGLKLAGINLLLGFAIPFIDNAAHTGGLVVGFLAGLCLGRKLPRQPGRGAGRFVRAAALAALLVAAAVPIGARVRTDLVALYRGADVDLELGRPARALARLDRAVAAFPGEPDLFFLRARVHERLGRRGRAVADYRKCLEIDESRTDARAALERLGE